MLYRYSLDDNSNIIKDNHIIFSHVNQCVIMPACNDTSPHSYAKHCWRVAFRAGISVLL